MENEKSIKFPKEYAFYQKLLNEMGVTEYQPSLINLLMDFTYKFTTDLLEQAKSFSQHANKKYIDVEDLKLAMSTQTQQLNGPLLNNSLVDYAKEKNNIPLPVIREHTGLTLPPDRHCLMTPNYKLKSQMPQPTTLNPNTNIRHPYGTNLYMTHQNLLGSRSSIPNMRGGNIHNLK